MALETTTAPLADGSWLRDQAFIGGQWCDADDGRTFAVTNPATGEVLANVPRMGAAETRRAIDAAADAFGPWRDRPAAERASLLRRMRDLMLEHRDDLALLLTLEQGKPLAESQAEVAYAAAFLEWFGEEAKRVYGDMIPSPQRDKRILVTKHPIGVCGGITPWNFPSAMVTRKAAPALAAGTPYKGVPFFLHYVTSKGAVIAMTRALAKELGGDNVLVNTIAPGFTLSDGVLANQVQVEQLKEVSAKARVLVRDQYPEDIVGAVLFFAGDESSFITGQSLVVDGGAYFN